MEIGVFGKLPDQRDYVQHGMDPAVMALIDPWIQQCLQASKHQLGDGWLASYLNAPIWRFWLGSAIVGKTVLGAIMPSVDGVGRYFPLLLTAVDSSPFDAPEIEPQDAWFTAAETLMLDALTDEGTYRALLDGISQMPAPVPGATSLPIATDSKTALAQIRIAQQQGFYGAQSFWWSPSFGDTAGPTTAYCWRGLPSPEEYAMLLSVQTVAQNANATEGE